MSQSDLRKLLVVDVEATCYPGNAFPQGERQQVIAIGLAYLIRESNQGDYRAQKGDALYVIPDDAPLSPFCTELTGLTDEFLHAHGHRFVEAMAVLRAAVPHTERYTWWSWGDFDRELLQAEGHRHLSEAPPIELDDYDARRHKSRAGLPRSVYPWGSTHFNAKAFCAMATRRKETSGFSMEAALAAMELTFDGTPHRAEDDAFNTARLIAACLNTMNVS